MSQASITNGKGTLAKSNDPAGNVHKMLLRMKEQIGAALPRHMTADRMIRVALTAIRSNPDLLECTEVSLAKCVVQASQLGLEPDPILGQCYLVPFNNKIKGKGGKGDTWAKECTLIIGYKGIISLARRSGELQSLSAHVVFEHDFFEYEFGLNERLSHRPADIQDRGGVTHAYAVATFKDGGKQFEVLNYWELEELRKRSKGKDNGPWVSDPIAMYRKCPVRQLGKFLPLCPELATQFAREEAREAGADVIDAEYVVGEPSTEIDPAKTKSAALAERLAETSPATKPTREPGDDGDPDGDYAPDGVTA